MTKKIKCITRLLLLTLLATFISCNDELYDIKDQHNGIDKNKISLTQFKNETKIDQVEPILSVHTKTSIASKSKSQLSDFVIDTLAIKRHISTDNKTTYTFRIYPLSSVAQTNDIYNLVYRKVNNNWETSIFYLKKLPKENSEHKLFEKIERIYGGKITNAITSKSSSLEMCSYENLSVHCDGSCERAGYSQCDGFACSTGQCVRRSINYMSCDSGGGSVGGNSDPGNTSGNGGEASGPYTYSPNYYDNPVFDDTNYINVLKRQYFWEYLDRGNQLWAENNVESYDKLMQYLMQNNWSDESSNLVTRLIEIASLNDLEYNFGTQSNINQDINNLNKLSTYVESIKFDVSDDTVSYNSSTNQNQIFGTTTIELSPIIDLAIEVVLTVSPSFAIDNNNSTSYILNPVVGNTWVQNSLILKDINYSSNKALLSLVGYVNIGVSIEGLEFGIKQRRKITFLMNKTTGEICCSIITKITK